MRKKKKVLSLENYPEWSRVVAPTLSEDGKLFAYSLRPNGADDTLHIRQVNGERIKTIPNGLNAAFSANANFFAYFTKPDQKKTKELRRARKPVLQKAFLASADGETRFEVEAAVSMAFSPDERFWMVKRAKDDSDKTTHKGSDLVVYDIAAGTATVIGNVTEYALNNKGTHLAYLVDARDGLGNGAYLLRLSDAQTRTLDASKEEYVQLTWNDAGTKRSEWMKKGDRLAFLKGTKVDSLTQTPRTLHVVSGIGSGNPQLRSLTTSATGFPEGHVISDKASVRFMADGKSVWLGIKEQEPVLKGDKDTIPNVDVWHWKDDYIQSVQIVRANRNRNKTYSALFNPDKESFTRLAQTDMDVVLPSRHNRYFVGRNDQPYISDINWGISPADLYRVDAETGEAKLFESFVTRALQGSPDGRYYLYQKDSAIMLYDLETDKKVNLTANTQVNFMDMEHPYPHENPPFGVAGWTKDMRSVILNHKYDLYRVSLDGKSVQNITQIGDQEEIRFRLLDLDPEEDYVDLKKGAYLTAYGEWTKKAGFYRLTDKGAPTPLLMEDALFGRPMKATRADVLLLTRQTFEQAPDYHMTDMQFKNMQQLTRSNPQQENYAWGSRKLVDFENKRGDKLQGTLTLPANYEEGKQYPTIIYFYEKMSDRHHQYSMPVYDDRPHMSYYASNGYMVFMPDQVFEEGRPGTSALDNITSAAQKLIDLGYADPEKIGLQGHSWSGYQTSFILTQTDMFRCIVTGAPPTNLESFYNNLYASTGTVHHGIMEIGQVRMGNGVTPWTHREAYMRENPMAHIPNIKTPFLILHGTADGAVDWAQGLELFNAARRMGKEVIFLSYPNEGHHLTNEANQKDFLTRMKEYFDYYLMEKEAPAWMESGIPHLEKVYDKVQ
ncbi:peptidase S9 prolyl oligopeptidase [Nitritalea halalkaliphila LW7]|uniref:Peptidase S9 prolyl oligopeptidase n=1 Tax=Nitritalea halalkaliphila LW7 TaxID=1189621 RepID=I5CA38_9BACT|nr:prolyl oligopeptidase family serine peptidase [Nitritalea halalkaliphila]EIM78690.1 peptidase S9 prolyl oligopeptidase [Nitritalea halalkaliphila LW7]